MTYSVNRVSLKCCHVLLKGCAKLAIMRNSGIANIAVRQVAMLRKVSQRELWAAETVVGVISNQLDPSP